MTIDNVEFDLYSRNGWCYFVVTAGDGQVAVRNYCADANLAELFAAVHALCGKARAVSVYWPHEIGEGHFIDLVYSPGGTVSLSVSKAQAGDGRNADKAAPWSSVRGELLMSANVVLDRFVLEFCRASRRMRTLEVDRTGFAAQMGISFPELQYLSLEREATRSFGFMPQSTAEIEADQRP